MITYNKLKCTQIYTGDTLSLSGRINILSHFSDLSKFSIVNLCIFYDEKQTWFKTYVYTKCRVLPTVENTPASLLVACLRKFQV